MSAIITSNLRVDAATKFMYNFSGSDSYYMFIGRVTPWADETSPDVPVNTADECAACWTEMIGAKKILPTGVTNVTRRIDWTTGTVYPQWDPASADVFDPLVPTKSNFFVITDEYRVFKCISNNGGAASTTKPTCADSQVAIITTADGYQWKFMFKISAPDALSFLVRDWIPVKYIASAITNPSDPYYHQWIIQSTSTDGHGNHPLEELGAFYVMITTQLNFDESGKLPTNNDYRKVGLLINPFNYGTTTVATASVVKQTRTVVGNTVTGNFTPDDVVWQGPSKAFATALATVVSWDSGTATLELNNITGTIATSTMLYNGTTVGDATAYCNVVSVGNPALAVDTGKVQYIENRRPINRASDQIEEIKLIVEF